ncbi:hypothetical protein [Lacticaseibacillus daqingensis]|uniref:hypothetical protein n=1 Tax=Lacticaseibacillus daqingensis TaxID=2486014 RepID=UPI000F77F640|nr:hypothetical protein [Lacticaseibacillus daqingensis]
MKNTLRFVLERFGATWFTVKGEGHTALNPTQVIRILDDDDPTHVIIAADDSNRLAYTDRDSLILNTLAITENDLDAIHTVQRFASVQIKD